MEGHTHPHHQYHQQQQPQQQQISGGTTTVGVGVEGVGDRFPQWSVQETKEFLAIRAELDRTFMETKRNKLLWEVISSKMRDLGFLRSAEQCKCKWKNLVTRYKGCETVEAESMRQQFPFYNEMQAIFTARMQRMLWAETEAGPGTSTKKTKSQCPTTTMSTDDEDEDDSDGDNTTKATKKRAKKAKICGTSHNITTTSISSINAVKEMLERFMKQQMEMEVEWREAYEAREEERRRAENEWRQRMEALENERLVFERRWREREEQRRLREDARADKRDALINALLNKLQRDT
ncbi:hypothetical protein RND81_08G156600 [Saponaria officinalis]|uniref:Myb-like domain-containing protein n=1 Tax=Saponaria officinalis TaxID=3572 RepID=A0AAW1J774_SAPOF